MNHKLVFLLFSLFICTVAHNRKKRYIFVNPTSPITLGFILNLPISLALPTVAYDGRSWNEILTLNTTGDSPEDLFHDINYSENIGTITSYFAYLQIGALSCQERLICEFAADPDAYSPVAELVLKELRRKEVSFKKSQDSLIWRYVSASQQGYISTSKECGEHYSTCPFPAYKLLNMQIIKVWQYLANKLNVRLL